MNPARAKLATDEAPVAPLRHLPGMDLALARCATRVARHARPLLLANHAVLLSMTSSTGDDRAPLTTRYWDARCALAAPAPIVSGDALLRRLAALEEAAKLLLADLIRRWPANALPPAVGIVTDGGGVAFSSDHPSPLSPNWLAQHQAGLCPTTALLPFSSGGAWSRLIAPGVGAFIH